MDMTTDCQIDNPAFKAIIPKVKDTAKYPRPMGIPSLTPDFNCFMVVFIISSLTGHDCPYKSIKDNTMVFQISKADVPDSRR